MRKVYGFDDYLSLCNDSLRVFIFVLGDELQNLDLETHWVRHLNVSVFVIRLSEEEFRILDFGVHPKVMIMKNGKEVRQFNGIPRPNELTKILREII